MRMTSETESGTGPRLIALLRLIAEGGRSFSLKEIAARANLPPSSVHRLLQILIRTGMVERGPQLSYGPGRELYRMASILRGRFDLGGTARPFLERLWSQWQETTVLCAFNPTSRTGSIVEALLTTHPLRFAVEIGMELALPWGSLGQAMLANLAPADVDAVLRNATIGPLSGRPLPPRAEVLADLARIRERGFADYFDPNYDVAGVAAPLFGRDRMLIGCIGITMPSQRFELHDRDGMTAAVREAAVELSELLALQA
jgi:DNA-binding IclR family transcriptional regulator